VVIGLSPYGYIRGAKRKIISVVEYFKKFKEDMKILRGFPIGTFRKLFCITSSRRKYSKGLNLRQVKLTEF
jgi:hypothetical protein